MYVFNGLQVIPAENLVASFQDKQAHLFAAATSASDAQVMMEALETGVAGVLLRTADPTEVRESKWLQTVLPTSGLWVLKQWNCNMYQCPFIDNFVGLPRISKPCFLTICCTYGDLIAELTGGKGTTSCRTLP